MNINFNYALKKGLYPQDVLHLMLIKYCGVKENNANQYFLDLTKALDTKNIVEYIKVAKNGNISLNTEGTKFLNDLSNVTEDLKTDEDNAILDYIVKYCEDNTDYIVGNKKQLLRNIINFRLASGFSSEQIFTTMRHFLFSDDSEYFKKFEYLFWKPFNAYDKKFSLQNSRLYNHYEKYKKELDSVLVE
jgi:hypothetical protein